MTELVLDCNAVEERGLVERYVAGSLDEENLRAFEIHLLGCAECQTDVRTGAAVREAMRHPEEHRRHHIFRIAGLAAAAAIVMVLLIPRATAKDPLTTLGATREAPVYLGVPIRGTADDSIFAAAMAEYSRRDFASAARQLRGVGGEAAVPAAFFRGSSLLMLGKADAATAEFSRVIALGASPYLAEAHFYRAKAHLLRGRANEALADLRAAAADSSVAEQARLLADSVRGISAR